MPSAPNFRGRILIVEDIGAHGEGIRNSFNLLLSIHHTSGEACLEGDGPGGEESLSALYEANHIAASKVWKRWDICARAIATAGLLLGKDCEAETCHARA